MVTRFESVLMLDTAHTSTTQTAPQKAIPK